MKKKEKIVLTESKLKKLTLEVLGVGIIAYALLCLVQLTGIFIMQTASWVLLFAITAAAAVQWSVLVCILYYTGKMEGKTKLRTVLKKTLAFIPAYVTVIALILIFALPDAPFSLRADNFFLGLMLFVLCCVVAFLIIEGIKMLARKKGWVVDFDAQLSRLPSEDEAQQTAPAVKKAHLTAVEGKKSADKTGGRQLVFPDLVAIDEYFAKNPYRPENSDDISLKRLSDGFEAYLEQNKMYYSPETIRAFIAGMACSHFLILEGLSGTGKTSLPKYFAQYIGSDVCFTSVQASWRDRSDVLGYYNDFSGNFKETPFLRALYTASYKSDTVNLMVLDEMNLARVEYYFADFLSVLELDPEKWKIELMPSSTQGKLPAGFTDGCSVAIPENTWFIGTANKDDSTFTITDKVYDRASVIDFSNRNQASGRAIDAKPVHIGVKKLNALFNEAVTAADYGLSKAEFDRFNKLSDFILDKFDINFGNRIFNQIMKFVPVYTACGGTAVKALDIMFSRKILRKLDGRFDEGIKADITALESLITQLYGREDFSFTLDAVAKLKRKLI